MAIIALWVAPFTIYTTSATTRCITISTWTPPGSLCCPTNFNLAISAFHANAPVIFRNNRLYLHFGKQTKIFTKIKYLNCIHTHPTRLSRTLHCRPVIDHHFNQFGRLQFLSRANFIVLSTSQIFVYVYALLCDACFYKIFYKTFAQLKIPCIASNCDDRKVDIQNAGLQLP